ncbi:MULTISPECIES: immunity 53 family protein [Paenibacillus]|jgi:hypothetical protein|uniref:Rhodanese-related sulfurtransferase n=1 Tax=Paenibacillus borealis TaxID=160799 RepID=A0ABX3HBS1_PAEBO|nr:immunity 53 family protein [Paenibacillus borealis]OMD46721.1 rhodanese-related sulfurtransferase [Paenibacillus borealis]
MNVLQWLEVWYSRQCDGDWEHSQVVSITTLDNPGWSVDIFLGGTELEDKGFELLNIDRSDVDWVYGKVSDNIFQGRGGVNNLEEILQIFQQWAMLNED